VPKVVKIIHLESIITNDWLSSGSWDQATSPFSVLVLRRLIEFIFFSCEFTNTF
jgi:hypothetical protein